MECDVAKLSWPEGGWAIIRMDRSWIADSPETKQLVEMIPDRYTRVPGAPGVAEWARELAVMLTAAYESLLGPEEIDPDAEY